MPSTPSGAGNVARACARAGARMIHISTDYVFSGAFDGAPRPYEIDDATGPLSVYGKTKLAGELAVHAALPDAHVVRTSWVYTGGDGSDFVAVMRRLAAATSPSTWSPTRSGRRPTSATWSRRCCEVAERRDRRRRCCTSPTTARPAGSSRRGRCSRARRGSGAGAAGGHRRTCRGPRRGRRIRRCPAAPSTAAGLTPLRPWREALAAALATVRLDAVRPLPSTP